MADFIQTGGNNGGTYAKYFSGKLSVWEKSYNVTGNYSVVGYKLWLMSGSSGRFSDYTATWSINVDGQIITGSGRYNSQNYNSEQSIYEDEIIIYHNNDGTKSINCSAILKFQSGTYSPGNFTPSGTLELTKIPRKPNFKSNPSIISKGLNWITFKYGSVDMASDLYYSLDNSTWIHINSDETTIFNLMPEKTYIIYVQARNQSDASLKTTVNISVTTYAIAKITSAPNVNIGSAHTITWTNPSGTSISLKLCNTDGTLVIDYGTVTGTSKTITPSASTIYAVTPNSKAVTLRYTITTFENNISYTNYKDCIFSVTNSNPIFNNFIYQDINATTTALTGNNQILIKGYSNVKGIISTDNKAIAQNSATISFYKMVIGNKSSQFNYNYNSEVSTSIDNIVSNVIDMYAIDSRGNSTKISKKATYKEYLELVIQSVTVTRSSNGVGKEVILKFNGNIWNNSFGSVDNTITSCKYQYKKTNSNTWIDGITELTYTLSDNNFNGSVAIKGDLEAEGFSVSNSFDIRLIVADKLVTKTYDVILGSGTPAIAIFKDKVAIGQKYIENEGSKLQVNGDISLTNRTNAININGHKGILKHWTNDTQISANDGSIYFRPKGNENTTNQVVINGDGSLTGKKFNGSSDKLECISGRISNANITHSYENNRAHLQLLQSTSSMTSNKPINDGYILHCSWDNNGEYQSQLYLPNNLRNVPLQFRPCDNGTWGSWENVYRSKTLYDNSSGTTGTVTLSETSANFSYLEIFFSLYNGTSHTDYFTTKIHNPNGKTFPAILVRSTNASIIQMYSKKYTANGTNIVVDTNEIWCDFNSSGLRMFGVNSSYLRILKVLGYR